MFSGSNVFFRLTNVYLIYSCLQSSSSTESDSLPFANENAGTIKQRANRPHPTLSNLECKDGGKETYVFPLFVFM